MLQDVATGVELLGGRQHLALQEADVGHQIDVGSLSFQKEDASLPPPGYAGAERHLTWTFHE